ncbi:MAG: hypothetical protein QNJ37_04080 [Crocosphaera sp.]|nr:hypothetical protein [Crocosphaera sp.]
MMNNQKLAPLSLSSLQNSLVLAHILSVTPGRIRIRVILPPEQMEELNVIILGLKNQLALEKVRTNLYSRSLTLFYNPKLVNSREFLDKLRELGVNFSKSSSKFGSVITEDSMTAVKVNRVSQDLNRYVRQASNNIVDLGVLIPLSFALLAGRQLIVKGWQLGNIPWYVLAWYAFDSFIKLHKIDGGSENRSQSN